MKLCKNCKHAKPMFYFFPFVPVWDGAECMLTGRTVTNPIDGKTSRGDVNSCYGERYKDVFNGIQRCGPDAKNFEPKRSWLYKLSTWIFSDRMW